MKKIIIIILVSILVLAAATSIISPFIDTDKNSSNRNDENIEEVSFFEMYAGDTILEEGTITVDGYLDDAYVLVSPSSGVTKSLSKMYYAGISEAAALADNQEDLYKSADMSYYIAQTEEKIYLLIKEIGGRWGDGATDFITRHNYYLRLGLNPNDYTQSAVIMIGVGSSSVEHCKVSRMSDVSNSIFSVTNFVTNASMIKYRIDENGDLIKPGTRGNNNMSSSYYGYIELELDKALMLEAFNNDTFSCNLDEFPGEMFIGLSAQAYSWSDDNKKNVTCMFYTWYGFMLTDEEKTIYNAKTALVPDKIVFGNEK